MKLVDLRYTIFLLPTIDFCYDFFDEGELIYLDLNISWLRWSLNINIIKEK